MGKLKREFTGELNPQREKNETKEVFNYRRNKEKKALKAYLRGNELYCHGYHDVIINGVVLSRERTWFSTPQRYWMSN